MLTEKTICLSLFLLAVQLKLETVEELSSPAMKYFPYSDCWDREVKPIFWAFSFDWSSSTLHLLWTPFSLIQVEIAWKSWCYFKEDAIEVGISSSSVFWLIIKIWRERKKDKWYNKQNNNMCPNVWCQLPKDSELSYKLSPIVRWAKWLR